MSVPELPAEHVSESPPTALAVTGATPGSSAAPSPGRADSVTATFLMTDIEGSTRLWAEQREAMTVALAAHDALLRDRRAAKLFGAADRLRVLSASAMLAIEQAEYHAAVLTLRGRMGEEAFERARADGRALTTEQAVAFAREG